LLVNHAIRPIAAQGLNDLPSAQVSRELHATATVSSRTKCRRIEVGRLSRRSK
jgi:hypothetical protein